MSTLTIIQRYVMLAWAWLVAHPEIGVPLVGGTVVWFTKKRSPEEYAFMASRWPTVLWVRLAALTQLAAAVFPDPIKARVAVIKFIFGIVEPVADRKPAKSKSAPPPPPPSTPPAGSGLAAVMFVLLGLGAFESCKPAQAPRESARSAVILLAYATEQLDQACASVALVRRDGSLATKCADAYDATRTSLIAAEDAVDGWDRGAAGDVPCATAKAVASLTKLREFLVAAGGRAPASVDDAFKLAPIITAGCHAL